MFEKIDLDGNGTIDYTEFVTATIEEKNLVTIDRLKMAFKMFDKDGSGALSPDEIKDVLCFDFEKKALYNGNSAQGQPFSRAPSYTIFKGHRLEGRH